MHMSITIDNFNWMSLRFHGKHLFHLSFSVVHSLLMLLRSTYYYRNKNHHLNISLHISCRPGMLPLRGEALQFDTKLLNSQGAEMLNCCFCSLVKVSRKLLCNSIHQAHSATESKKMEPHTASPWHSIPWQHTHTNGLITHSDKHCFDKWYFHYTALSATNVIYGMEICLSFHTYHVYNASISGFIYLVIYFHAFSFIVSLDAINTSRCVHKLTSKIISSLMIPINI